MPTVVNLPDKGILALFNLTGKAILGEVLGTLTLEVLQLTSPKAIGAKAVHCPGDAVVGG